MDLTAKGRSCSDTPPPLPLQTADSSTQTSQPTLAAQGQVTLRWGNSHSRTPCRTSCRPRPSSMVDFHSYQHTQQPVRRILEQPAAQGLVNEVQELVDSIRNVLQSDEEHMEEAVRCASYIEQMFTDSEMNPSTLEPTQQQQPPTRLRTSRPQRRSYGVLHLQSCGDLSSFTCAAPQSLEPPVDHREVMSRTGSRTGSHLDWPDRPHSLIGVFKETVL